MVIRVQNEHTYSAADGGQKICRVFSETAAFESDGVKHERKSIFSVCVCVCVFPILAPRAIRRTNSSISDFSAIRA